VALSTAEAETNASVEAVKQIMHFRLFMREFGMGQDGPSVVYEDNQAASNCDSAEGRTVAKVEALHV
jgi:hypothetical protein